VTERHCPALVETLFGPLPEAGEAAPYGSKPP
jgi:hypothetical protein